MCSVKIQPKYFLLRRMEKTEKGWLSPLADVSAIVAIPIALAGLAGTRHLYVLHNTQMAKPVTNLWQSFRRIRHDLQPPIVQFSLNPYKEIHPKRCLIVQGRNKEGKTTLFATCLPWYRRFFSGPYRGILFNGAAGTGVSTFEKWQTTQLFGTTVSGGSELQKTLEAYQSRQWIRSSLSSLGFPIFERPAYIVVDQFEELLKRWPDEVMGWANFLANLQARESLAKVFFVVNSKAATQSLLNLNQGRRFDFVVLEPATKERVEANPNMDADRFEICERNIGLYKDQERTDLQKLPAAVSHTLARWERDYHIPYPAKYDPSWGDMDKQEFKQLFLSILRRRLEDIECSKDEINNFITVTSSVLRLLEIAVVCNKTWEEWYRLLDKIEDSAARERLTTEIKQVLAHPSSWALPSSN